VADSVGAMVSALISALVQLHDVVMPLMVSGAVPVFVMVKSVDTGSTFPISPKSKLVGEAVACGNFPSQAERVNSKMKAVAMTAMRERCMLNATTVAAGWRLRKQVIIGKPLMHGLKPVG